MSTQAGKGDTPRPTKKSVYNENYDEIKWNSLRNVEPKKVKKAKGKTTYTY